MAVKIRKVAYHPQHGVFLVSCAGVITWSKDSGVLPEMWAQTFEDQEDLDTHLKNVKTGPLPEGTYLQEVFPSHGDFANANDCANAGLPRWGEGKFA
jgi:hypothetical protein